MGENSLRIGYELRPKLAIEKPWNGLLKGDWVPSQKACLRTKTNFPYVIVIFIVSVSIYFS